MRSHNWIIKLFTETSSDLLSISVLLLRSALGVILFVVGAGKVLGWFGGFGMEATIGFYAQSGISLPLTYMSCYTEFIGGLLIAAGFLTRPAAFAVSINMIVATIITLPTGFFGSGGGASYPFIFAVIAIVILFTGPMAYSVDSLILSKSEMPSDSLNFDGNRQRISK